MTFCSNVHVIEHVGPLPILVDDEPDILNIEPRKVENPAYEATGRGGDKEVGVMGVGETQARLNIPRSLCYI